MKKRASKSSTASAYPTIAEDALAYSNLLRGQNRGAESQLSHIRFRLRTEPVDEVDVQVLWELFPYPEIIEAILCNIVKFDLFNTQPTGGYIHQFIENEMTQLHERGQERLVEMYEKQLHARHYPKAAKLKGRVYRPIHHACRRVKQSAEKRAKDLYMRAVLLPELMKL